MSGPYRIGKRGIARLCGDLFRVPISPAMVCKLQHHTTDALAPVTEHLRAQVVGCPANVDETGWYQHGQRRWLWAAVTRAASVFVVSPSRSREALSALIGREPGVLTTDRYPVYDHVMGRARQVCGAHVRRDFQAMIDRADEGRAIGEPLLGCADRLLTNWKRVTPRPRPLSDSCPSHSFLGRELLEHVPQLSIIVARTRPSSIPPAGPMTSDISQERSTATGRNGLVVTLRAGLRL